MKLTKKELIIDYLKNTDKKAEEIARILETNASYVRFVNRSLGIRTKKQCIVTDLQKQIKYLLKNTEMDHYAIAKKVNATPSYVSQTNTLFKCRDRYKNRRTEKSIKRKIIKLINSGLRDKEIASKVNMTQSSIYQHRKLYYREHCKKNGINLSTMFNNKELLVDLSEYTMTNSQISDKYKIPQDMLLRFCILNNLRDKVECKTRTVKTLQICRIVKECKFDSLTEIAKTYNMSLASLKHINELYDNKLLDLAPQERLSQTEIIELIEANIDDKTICGLGNISAKKLDSIKTKINSNSYKISKIPSWVVVSIKCDLIRKDLTISDIMKRNNVSQQIIQIINNESHCRDEVIV